MPAVYTWPAGYPRVFGYTYDRELSEFTVFHFKQFIRIISGMPEVEGLHVIAHSWGTDAATAGLRELFKIENLILAAHDLDIGVLGQRLTSERLARAVVRTTTYVSPSDKAIGIAER